MYHYRSGEGHRRDPDRSCKSTFRFSSRSLREALKIVAKLEAGVILSAGHRVGFALIETSFAQPCSQCAGRNEARYTDMNERFCFNYFSVGSRKRGAKEGSVAESKVFFQDSGGKRCLRETCHPKVTLFLSRVYLRCPTAHYD